MECKRKYSHPGVIIKHLIFDERGLSLRDAAALLGVTLTSVSVLVKGKVDISADMAMRMAKVFGGNADYWLRMQARYHFDEVSTRIEKLKLKRYEPGSKKSRDVKRTKNINRPIKKAA